MAVVLVLGASILGLISAIVSCIFFGFGLLAALALWSGTGIIGTVFGLLLAAVASSRTQCASNPEVGTVRVG